MQIHAYQFFLHLSILSQILTPNLVFLWHNYIDPSWSVNELPNEIPHAICMCFGVDSILLLSIYFIHGHTFPCTTTKNRTQISAKNTQISAKSTQNPARVHKVGFLCSFKFSNLVAYHHEKIWPGARGMEQTSVNACHIRQSWSFTISCRLTSTQGGNWLEVYYTLKEPKSWYCIVQLLINSSYGSKIRT